MVHVLGFVEDKSCFNLVSYLKSKVRNCLKCHLQLVVAVYAHKFFTLDSFPYKVAYDVSWANVQSRTCWGQYAWIVKLFVCPSFPWHVGITLPLYGFTGLFFSCVCENSWKTETLLMEDNLLVFFFKFKICSTGIKHLTRQGNGLCNSSHIFIAIDLRSSWYNHWVSIFITTCFDWSVGFRIPVIGIHTRGYKDLVPLLTTLKPASAVLRMSTCSRILNLSAEFRTSGYEFPGSPTNLCEFNYPTTPLHFPCYRDQLWKDLWFSCIFFEWQLHMNNLLWVPVNLFFANLWSMWVGDHAQLDDLAKFG